MTTGSGHSQREHAYFYDDDCDPRRRGSRRTIRRCTHAGTHELRRQYFSDSPSLSFSPRAQTLTRQRQASAIYTYAFHARSSSPAALSWTTTVWTFRLSRSRSAKSFCPHARAGALLLTFLLFLLLFLSLSGVRPYTCARDHVNTRREPETAEPLRDCLLSCRIHAHTLFPFVCVCTRFRMYTCTFLALRQCEFSTGSIYRVARK